MVAVHLKEACIFLAKLTLFKFIFDSTRWFYSKQ